MPPPPPPPPIEEEDRVLLPAPAVPQISQPDIIGRVLAQQPPPDIVERAIQRQPQRPVFTQEAFDRAFRANLDERFSRPFGPDADPSRFTIEKAATGLIGAIPGGFAGALAGSFAAVEQGGNLVDQFAGAARGAVEGARQLSRTAVEEDLLGLQGLSPTEVDLETPATTRPWWWAFPGGLGTFEEIRQSLQAGVLIPDVTPQLQLALGFSDTDMLEAGYIFDEATNKWILPESQPLEDAQAGLGGFGGGVRRTSGGGGGFNISFPSARGGSFPSSPRSAQGVGLTNWRI